MDARFDARSFALPALLMSLLAPTPVALAQGPEASLNLGMGLELRLENAHDDVNDRYVGTSKLVLTTLVDSTFEGPYVVSLEQGGKKITTATCSSYQVGWSGTVVPGVRAIDECASPWFPAADLKTSAPVDVVIAAVDDATDARTEVYRGSYGVLGFWAWEGMKDGAPIHVEQRTLRLDSMYGAAYVRQYMGWDLQFTYVMTRDETPLPRDTALRCKVGDGAWTAYEISLSDGAMQTARNRVNVGGDIREGAGETLLTTYVRFSANRMPIGVEGGVRDPAPDGALDGAWTCELRSGDAGARVVQREFRFVVRGGNIQRHAIEGELSAGRGSVLVAIGFDKTAGQLVIDPKVVEGTLVGRPLKSGTAPLLWELPAKATTITFTAPRGAKR